MNTLLPDPSTKRFRKRPPRIFGEDQLIIPYNYDHSVGNEYIKRIGLTVNSTEEFKFVDTGEFRINGKFAKFCLVLTDRMLYIIHVKTYGVKRFTEIKLHKLKSIECSVIDKTSTNLDIHTHVPIDNRHNLFHLTKLDNMKAEDLVRNIKQVMESLRMDILVKVSDDHK
jgi:hypothetical protein